MTNPRTASSLIPLPVVLCAREQDLDPSESVIDPPVSVALALPDFHLATDALELEVTFL